MDPLFVSLQLGFCHVGIGNGPFLGGQLLKPGHPEPFAESSQVSALSSRKKKTFALPTYFVLAFWLF